MSQLQVPTTQGILGPTTYRVCKTEVVRSLVVERWSWLQRWRSFFFLRHAMYPFWIAARLERESRTPTKSAARMKWKRANANPTRWTYQCRWRKGGRGKEVSCAWLGGIWATKRSTLPQRHHSSYCPDTEAWGIHERCFRAAWMPSPKEEPILAVDNGDVGELVDGTQGNVDYNPNSKTQDRYPTSELTSMIS